MKKFAGDWTKIAAQKVGGITLIVANDVSTVEIDKTGSHSLIIPQAPTVCLDVWQGERQGRREWNMGDLCFVPKGSSLLARSERRYDETVLLFDDRFFTTAANDHIDYSAIQFRYADVTEKSTQSLASAMTHIVSMAAFTEWPLLIESNALALVVAIICALSPKATTAFQEKPYGLGNSRKKLVIDYIDANLHRQISLRELAEVACLSPFHFSRLFKKRVGMSPLSYLAQRRVDEAKKQLRLRGATLAQVALECGFASQSHFTTVFKTVTGNTPGQYRKALV